VASRLDVLDESPSTNAELVARLHAPDSAAMPEFTVVATTNQTAGRGRLGRSWVAPPRTAIAISVLLRPDAAALDRLGWLPLAAGLAMTRAVASLLMDAVAAAAPAARAVPAVTLKWPNDVQLDGLKVAGLLAELVPAARLVDGAPAAGSAAAGPAVVLGAGLNLTMTADQLPTETATSLAMHGASPEADEALAAYLRELRALIEPFAASGYDAARSGLAAAVSAACSTLGKRVRVELPGGENLYGVATSIDDDGRLVVLSEVDDRPIAVAAGDVTHLRYA
jgi:BirA family transcriptional regulator, biotin operon repressor / biotin---[acetyl-CoA-carboxylase] ligase